MVSNLVIISISAILIIAIIIYINSLYSQADKDYEEKYKKPRPQMPILSFILFAAYPIFIIGLILIFTIILLYINNNNNKISKSNNSSMYRSTNINIRNRNKYV